MPYHTPRRFVYRSLIDETTEKRLRETIPIPVSIHQIQLARFTINYAQAGSGAPLLLIHGGNLGWGQWYANIADLAKHFTVYAIDLPGGGRSSRVDFANLDPENDLVNTVGQFIERLKLRRFHMVGSSIGGWIALKIAHHLSQQTDKVIVSDTVGFTSYVTPVDQIMGIHPLAKLLTKTILKPVPSNKNIEKFLRSPLHNEFFPLKQEFIDYFYETMQTSHNLLFISRLAYLQSRTKSFLLVDDLPKIKNKVLIIWGENDKLLPLNKYIDAFKLLPHSQVEILKNVGHFPNIEDNKTFNRLVIQFLKM